MKRIIVISVVLLTGSNIIFSQAPRFGFDLGFNLSQADFQPEAGNDRRIIGGFDGGLLVEFTISPKFKIQPEINYTITGVELNNGSSEASIKLQYITIPVLAKLNIAGGLNLLAGPSHGILLSAWNDPSGSVPSTRIKELFKFTDLLLVVGAEYKCRNGLFIGTRYNHGMEQIAEDSSPFEMKNRYLSFRLGYIFGGGK